jgi:hypothetical protein
MEGGVVRFDLGTGRRVGGRSADRTVTPVPRLGPTRLAPAVLCLMAVLLASACSDDGNTASPSTSDGVPSTTTSAVVTTTTSTTTVPNTSSSPVPRPTSSTVPPVVATEATARESVDRAIASFRECLAALPACDVTTLAGTRAGTMLQRNTERIQEWNAAGYALRRGERFRYVIEAVEVAPDLRQATVTVCSADGSQLVLPGAGPGGADVIIDDSFTSGREAWDVRLDADGVWRVHAAPAIGPTEASDVCPAS